MMWLRRVLIAVVFAAVLGCPSVALSAEDPAPTGAAAWFDRLDKNSDGVLTADELPRPALFRRADKDGDGKLTGAEAAVALGQARPTATAARKPALPAPAFANESYGSHKRNVFDLWKPAGSTPAPLVVFIHGGGFRGGDKSALSAGALKTALDAGACVMSITYRFLPDAPVQDILRDCARAIQYVRLNAAKYGIDPKRVACYGSSAGAGTSLWLAVHDDLADPKSADPAARQSSRISAAACLNGQATYDLVEWEEVIYPFRKEWYASPDEKLRFYHFKTEADLTSDAGRKIRADCSMLGLLGAGDPPLFLLCSNEGGPPRDRGHLLHHPKHVEVLAAKARSAGVPVETQLKSGANADARKPGEPQTLAVGFLLKHLGLTPLESIKAE